MLHTVYVCMLYEIELMWFPNQITQIECRLNTPHHRLLERWHIRKESILSLNILNSGIKRWSFPCFFRYPSEVPARSSWTYVHGSSTRVQTRELRWDEHVELCIAVCDRSWIFDRSGRLATVHTSMFIHTYVIPYESMYRFFNVDRKQARTRQRSVRFCMQVMYEYYSTCIATKVG